jgi:hypothetical protein
VSMYRLKSEEDLTALQSKLRAARTQPGTGITFARPEAGSRAPALRSDPPKKQSKYRNKRVERHGLKFDSILEADWFDHLTFLRRIGEVLWFARQVNFELPGGVKLRVDYVVIYRASITADGIQLARPEVHDTKGHETRESINKRKMVKAIHGVDVRIITRDDLKARGL